MENRELIERAIQYIRTSQSDTALSVDTVAEQVGFSTDYFNRIFATHTGFTVMEYVRFLRLRKASLLLRSSERDILDIALEVGYESHESFTRAFKKQYGRTPSEFREAMRATEAWYGEYHHETLSPRLLYEFPGLRQADSDEVIDLLLERDAIRFGYPAVCFVVNGGAALYAGSEPSAGFVWCTEWDGGRIDVEIFTEDYDEIARYCKIFKGERFVKILYLTDEPETIEAELAKRSCHFTVSNRVPEAVYRGTPYEIRFPENYAMRELTYGDRAIIEAYYQNRSRPVPQPYLYYLFRELESRDVHGCSEHSIFLFGIFHGETLVGLSQGALQRAHGFVVNNCVETGFADGYASEELYRCAFQFVTNAALDRGALPIDDIQYPGGVSRCGMFDAVELGYEVVLYNVELQEI